MRTEVIMTANPAEKLPGPGTDRVVNVASVPHRSPFRYPGGKTWLVPRIRQWLRSLPSRPAFFLEPFAGGAIIGLSVVFEGLADRSVLVELDRDVAAVFLAITGGQAEELCRRIRSFEVTEPNVRAALAAEPTELVDRAFQTVLRNRMQRGGILARGATILKQGENGKGLLSRWYVETLCRRIRDIAGLGDRVRVICGDGLRVMREQADDDGAVWFLDPPYTVAGRRLYTHSDMDHRELFRLTARLRGDFLMTYDDNAFIRGLAAESGFDMQTVAMKNTHHAVMSELLVGHDLNWARNP
jgi:DNA adenine methylase